MFSRKIEIFLASESPRRRKILECAGFRVHVLARRDGPEEEFFQEHEKPRLVAERLANQKMHRALRTFQKTDLGLFVTADTVVACKGRLLGKPKNPLEARRMLEDLSGSWHEVWTAVAVRCLKSRRTRFLSEKSRVRFRRLYPREIADYIRRREAYDKAGGYAIQGTALGWVKAFEGDFWNVVGFPLSAFCHKLFQWGWLRNKF